VVVCTVAAWGFLAPVVDLRRARSLTLRSLTRSYRDHLAQLPGALWEATTAAFTKFWIVPFGMILFIIVMWLAVVATAAHAVLGDDRLYYLGWMAAILVLALGTSISFVRTVRAPGKESRDRPRHQAR
jgi:hypothetical protein